MARKILLADDSVTAQNMGRKILADAGYDVITVNNGSAALKKVNETKPDVIVLDVYMPGYSGMEVCQRLKEASETARIPILLTVGKLEPFKPEEAKRCRADAFIIKPFEASELLSALSKLEDKIVPRPEPHKPGRFARAIAAVEEGRYDKSMAVEEDTGWKHRIQFPSAKKGKPAEEKEQDTDEFYNPLNKDLRTTVDHTPLRRPEPVKEEGPRVDMGALAYQGLPKDVTPEEIAALAAAAAQIKGTGTGKHEPEKAAETRRAAEPVAEKTSAEVPADAPSVSEPAAQPAVQAEASTEARSEAKQETPAVEAAKESAPPAVEAVAAKETKEKDREAEQKEEAEVPAHKPSEAVPASKAPDLTSSIAADMTLAITALPLGTYVSLAPSSGNGSDSHAPEGEPVTMAAAAGAASAHGDTRWMAVPVALAPEEASLSLEQEMQKSYAAFAAADAAQSAGPAPPAESQAAAFAEPPVEAPVAQPAAPASEGFMPEVARTMSSVATATTDAIKAAVREFEHVAAALVESKPEETTEPVPAPAAESKAEPPSETAPVVEAKAEEPAAETKVAGPEAVSQATPPESAAEEPKAEVQEAASRRETNEPPPQPEQKKESEQKQEEPQPVVQPETAAPIETSANVQEAEKEAPVAVSQTPAEPAANQTIPQITEDSEQAEPAAGGTDDMAKKEQEVAASTAAAWASWRRIRETGGPKGKADSKKEAEEAAPEKDDAAMAVAAGAEKAPEEAPAEGESAEIASIVDSVLADMRPKIVEEISKKMGKIKK